MFWPKEKKKYEYLKTAFTNLVRLVDDLHHSGFKGFLEVISDGKKNYILILDGADRLFQQNTAGKLVPFEGGTEKLVNEVSPDSGIINVYEADPQHLLFIMSCINAAPLYTNLSSEFTDFEKLLSKFRKDGLNGYLEIVFHEASLKNAYFIYNNGRISDIFIGEEQVNTNKDKFGGIDLLLNKNEALFNVYLIDKDKKIEIPLPEADKKDIPQNTLPEKDKTASPMDKSEAEAILNFAEVEKSSNESSTDSDAVSGSPKPLNLKEQLSIKSYLEFSGILLKWVETAMNQVLGKEYFSKAFKKGLLNISDKYPFLDPFLAEFTYKEGIVQFSSDTTTTEFFSGLYAAIEAVFDELNTKERREIGKILKNTLQSIEKGFHEDIEVLRVRTLMPLLFQ